MPEPSLDGAQLAAGIRSGEPRSWRVLYEELGERAFRLVLRITGDEEVATDLTHDAFVLVAERGSQYTGRGSIKAWVFQIAANLARDWLRTTKRRRTLLEERTDVAHPSRTLWGGGGGLDAETRMVLRRAVAELAEGQRTVLLLYDVDGYTHPEIATMLDIAEGTSKARLSRARARLRDRLKTEL